MKKEEFERVDMRIPDYENTWSEISRSSSLCFKINHTDPMEESSRSLVRELIPGMPESSLLTATMTCMTIRYYSAAKLQSKRTHGSGQRSCSCPV